MASLLYFSIQSFPAVSECHLNTREVVSAWSLQAKLQQLYETLIRSIKYLMGQNYIPVMK